MNLWQDDESRSVSHRRGAARRLKTSIRTLMVVIGWLALVLALFLAAASWRRPQEIQHRLLVLSGAYVAGGGGLILLHALCFLLPEFIKSRRSESAQRRRQDRRSHVRGGFQSMASSASDGKDGIALVLVLVMLGLITILVVETQVSARALVRRTESMSNQSALRRAAGDAVRAALQRLANDEDLRADYTNETCFATEDLTTPDGIATHVVVTDANRYFDVNNLAAKNVPPRRTPADILGDLFTLCGDFAPSAYVTALGDWVDDNDEGMTESRNYQKRVPPYACPNRCMYDWNEMLAAEEGRRERFDHHVRATALEAFNADLVDCITLCPPPRERPLPLNVNTATKEALQGVVGIGQDEMVKTLLVLRTLKPIRSLDSALAVTDPEFSENIRPYLDVRSRFFRVDARAYANNRAVNLRILAERDPNGQVDIVQWVF